MKTFKTSVLAVSVTSFVSVHAYAGGTEAINAATQAAPMVAMGVMANSAMGGAAAAGVAGGLAGGAAGASTVTAGALRGPCHAPGGQMMCVMMGLAVVQVGMALFTRSGAKKSQAQLLGTGYGGTDGGSGTSADNPSLTETPTTYTTADGTTVNGDTGRTANALVANGLGGLADDYVKSAQAVQASGVEVSSDGQSVKMPNGKTVPTSAFSSPEAMRAAGMSNAEISDTQRALSEASKIAASASSKVASLTNDVGGGGGGSLGGAGGAGSGSGSGYGDGAGAYGKLGLNGKNNKANVSGMSKKFGNDNIGVAGDDIFEMVSRRYQSKDKVDTFLKN